MEKGLSAQAFAKLLDHLADDRAQAGEKYEELRRILLRFFEWRGGAFPEELTDETLNRVAEKLDAGVEIRNIGAYCHEVGRFVYLESLRSHDKNHVSLDATEIKVTIPDTTDETSEKELRMTCLDTCLDTLPSEGRELITEYYRDDSRARIDHRQALAQRLGLRRDALANRAQRLRDKLELCVKKCVRKDH